MPKIHGDLSQASGEYAANILLEQNPEITALVTFSDSMAIGALCEIHRRGISVPQDLSITGIDNLPLTAELSPPLTTVDQCFELLGVNLVDHLMAVINGESPGIKILEPNLIVRSSTGPVLQPILK